MIRQMFEHFFQPDYLYQEVLDSLPEDPRRSRIAKAVAKSSNSPAVQRAYNLFIETWEKEAKRDYVD